MSILSPQEIAKKVNTDLKSFNSTFKINNDFNNISLDVEIESRVSEGKLLGFGADEFHAIKISTPVMTNVLKVNAKKAMIVSSEISYDRFSRRLIDYLLYEGIVKVSCKLKKKKL